MNNRKKFVVSHAPFWHDGSSIAERNVHIILAALPAVAMSVYLFGAITLGVVALSVSFAMLWETLFNRMAKRPETLGDGSAALIGLTFAMMMPPMAPWWVILVGTFIAVWVGREIFGGIGGNPFHPAVLAVAVLGVSWNAYLDFDTALASQDLGFTAVFPLAAVKQAVMNPDLFNVQNVVVNFDTNDLLMGRQVGGIGATFGLGLILGGVYLMIRGFIRWEISLSFIAGVFVTALIFNVTDPTRYANPIFHLLTGYTLLGAFFLATDDASSPVNFLPMLIYGFMGGLMTVLIRNIGVYPDGVVYAILIVNLVNPLLDKIRPKALGKVGA